jgi:SLOG cluster4 family
MIAENAIDNIDRIKEKYGFGFILAFSGGADTKLPQLVNDQSQQSQEIQQKHDDLMGERIEKLIYDCLRKFDGLQHRIAIQTGGTKGGVPEVATKVAKKLGFRTIGIYPEVGAKYALSEEYIDFPICIASRYQDCKQQVYWQTDSHWGDESPVFAKHLDAVIAIGGSAGTAIELAYILKMNAAILKARHRSGSSLPKLKFIVPVSGFGGVSESIHQIWADREVLEKSILSASSKPGRIHDGFQAGDALLFNDELAIRELHD